MHDVNLNVDIADAVLDVSMWEQAPMSTSVADVNFTTFRHGVAAVGVNFNSTSGSAFWLDVNLDVDMPDVVLDVNMQKQ